MSIERRGRPGRFLRYARRKSGLTQAELGELAGVPQSVIGRIESGATMPRFDTLDRLLNACGFALELEPRIGTGVDRSLMEPLLALSAADRAETAAAHARAVDELLATATRS